MKWLGLRFRVMQHKLSKLVADLRIAHDNVLRKILF